MPAVYQDGDFGLRFLESLETTLDPIVATLDVLSRYFHSTLAPRDVLGLLASWVGLPVDESWPDDRLREALSRESEISRRRGTLAGLSMALEIAFPQLPLRVEDGGGVTWSTDPNHKTKAPPPSFVVYCDTPIPEKTQLAVTRVIEETKPVHVTYKLRVKAAKKPRSSSPRRLELIDGRLPEVRDRQRGRRLLRQLRDVPALGPHQDPARRHGSPTAAA